MLNLDEITEECPRCGYLNDVQVALVEELREARAEIGRLRALMGWQPSNGHSWPGALEETQCAEKQATNDYLIIVQYNFSADAWIVDEDSRHTLEDDSDGAAIKELRVCAIRDLFLEDADDRT